MVLGGGNDTRPFLAAALLRHGLATQVIVARSAPSLDTQDGMVPSEDEVVARVLAHQGISAGHLVRLPGACTSTRDEARALAGFLREHPGVRVTVVTSSYHTRRARRVFRRALGAEASRIAFLGAPTEGFGPTDWWQCRDGFGTYMNELGKMAYDLVRY